MTSEQRAQINVMRNSGLQMTPQNAPKADALEINGFFFKNRDKREKGVIWANGQQLSGDKIDSDMRMKKINESDKTVSVQMEKDGSSMILKPGQKLMLDDGIIQDAYEP